MLRKRPITSTTLLAWTVVKTRWPVRADWTAICAVSSSRISPTMILSGSWRRIERSPRAKVRPFFSLTGIWVMPLSWYSTGSSMVTILSSVETISDRQAYRVVVLPDPVGPGHQHHAVGLVDELAQLALGVVLEAEHIEVEGLELGVGRLLVEDTDHRVLAVHGRHDGDAEVDGAAREPDLEAAVLGDPLLGDVELRHDLDPADDGRVVALVDRLHRLVEHAVDAVLDHDLAVLGLDVDVRRPALDGVEEDRVDQPDDRRLSRR